MPDVAVIGAGIAGLVTAHHLADAGADVTVFEAGERAGGQLHTVPFAGRPIDVGAEAIPTAAPGALALLERLGLHDEVVTAASGPTWIWSDRGLRPLPTGFGPAGPTRLLPVLRSRVLSLSGSVRAGLEPLVPRATTDDDISVGDYLDRRFGQQVTERLVDPLLGGLHSGDVHRLSLTSATPQLAALAGRHRSLLLRRRRPAPPGAAFVAVRGGMALVAERLAARTDGIDLHTGARVNGIGRANDGRVRVSVHDEVHRFDAAVIATPAHATAGMVGAASHDAASGLRALRTATVAITLLAYPATAATLPAFRGTGMLVPRASGRLLKAATFLTTKWPHLDTDGRVLVRASAGRVDDDRAAGLDDPALIERVQDELALATGLTDTPTTSRVYRWPTTMPQLEVGHGDRLRGIGDALGRDLPGVVLAGAPYHGPGLAACVRSGTNAAERITSYLEERPA